MTQTKKKKKQLLRNTSCWQEQPPPSGCSAEPLPAFLLCMDAIYLRAEKTRCCVLGASAVLLCVSHVTFGVFIEAPPSKVCNLKSANQKTPK